MKEHLYGTLRDKGMIDNLKSQIRHRLIKELSSRGTGGSLSSARCPPHQDDASTVGGVLDRAATSLIADYLHKNSFEFSLSVFVPEVGLSSDKLFTSSEILDILKIGQDTELYTKLNSIIQHNSNSFLLSFLTVVSEHTSKRFRDCDSQTDNSQPPLALCDRFEIIDQRFDIRKHDLQHGDNQFVEERILLYQRELEQKVRQEMKAELERFKQTELSKMRLEEREKLQHEFDTRRREMDVEYRNRLNNIMEKERQTMENCHKQQETYDREAYIRRQSLLEEVDMLRQRENQLRREQEAWERERLLLQDKIRGGEDDLLKRESRLKSDELAFERRLKDEVEKVRLAEESKYVHKWKEVELLETRNKEEARIVENEKSSVRTLREQLLEKQALFNEMEVIDYPTIKQDNVALRSELDGLKVQLAELKVNYEREKDKVESLLREMATPSATQQHAEASADEARETLRREQTLWDHQRTSLEKRLSEEMTNSKSLLQRYEEQSSQMREVAAEVSELRAQLVQTEQALTHEVHRRGATGGGTSRYILTPRSARSARSDYGQGHVPPLFSARADHSLEFGDADDMMDNSAEDDVSGFEEVLAETKWRLKSLDQETEHLAEEYRSFQSRLVNPFGSLPFLGQGHQQSQPPPPGMVLPGAGGLGSGLLPSQIASLTSTTHSGMRGGSSLPNLQSDAEPIKSCIESKVLPYPVGQPNIMPPLMPPSAQAYLHLAASSHSQHQSPPSLDISTVRPSETQPPPEPSSVSAPMRNPGMLGSVGDSPFLAVTDLDKAHSGAPSVIGLPIDHSHTLPRDDNPIERHGHSTAAGVTFELPLDQSTPPAEGGATSRDVGSADLLGPSEHPSASHHAVEETIFSLDDTWKSKSPSSGVEALDDEVWEQRRAQRRAEREDREEQERRKQEAELRALRGEAEDALEPREITETAEDTPGEPGIDPVMQKYMAMVVAQRQTASKPASAPRTSTPPPLDKTELDLELDLDRDDDEHVVEEGEVLSQAEDSSEGFW